MYIFLISRDTLLLYIRCVRSVSQVTTYELIYIRRTLALNDGKEDICTSVTDIFDECIMKWAKKFRFFFFVRRQLLPSSFIVA